MKGPLGMGITLRTKGLRITMVSNHLLKWDDPPGMGKICSLREVFFLGSSGKCQSPSKLRISNEHDAVFFHNMTSTWGVYLHKSGICQVVVSDSLILVINPSQRHFSGVIPEKTSCVLMPLPTTVCNKVPRKKAQGLHWRSMINDAYPSWIYKELYLPKDSNGLTVNISYIRLGGCICIVLIILPWLKNPSFP